MFRGIKFLLIVAITTAAPGLFAKATMSDTEAIQIISSAGTSTDFSPYAKCAQDAAGDRVKIAGCATALQFARENAIVGQSLLQRTLTGMGMNSNNGNSNGSNSGGGSGAERSFSFGCQQSPMGVLKWVAGFQGATAMINAVDHVMGTYYSNKSMNNYINQQFAYNKQVSHDMRQCNITGNCNYIPLGTDPSAAPWYVIPANQSGAVLMAQSGYSPYGAGYGSLGYGGLYNGFGGYGASGIGGSYLLNSQVNSALIASTSRGTGYNGTAIPGSIPGSIATPGAPGITASPYSTYTGGSSIGTGLGTGVR